MQIPHPAALVSSAELSPDQQTPTHPPSAVSEGPEPSLPLGSLPAAPRRSAFISILPSFALKKILTIVASFAFGPYLPPPNRPTTPAAATSSPTRDGEMLLSMCLFREKWPFVSAAPRHRRSRRLTPAE